MKIAVHITFFFVESRLPYLRQVVNNLEGLNQEVQFFIYTNKDFNEILSAENIQFKIFPYKKWGLLGYNQALWNKLGLTTFVHPYYLAWENRKVIEKNIDEFDVQMYIEDDIAFNIDTFNYWIRYKDICSTHGFNLGFLRIEFDSNRQTYLTDLKKWPQKIIEIDDQLFLINDVNPYCAFWIYDRADLKEFIKTKEWKFQFSGEGIREKSAIGWHGTMMNRYKNTIIPLYKLSAREYLLPKSCMVHHIPNNYTGNRDSPLLMLPEAHKILVA
jgi:hypothetical protein